MTIALLGFTLSQLGCSKLLSDKDPQEACTFVQNKSEQRVSWKDNLPVKFRVHKDVPASAKASIEAAAMKWNIISSKNVIEIIDWEASETAEEGYSDGRPTIYWQTDWEKERKSEQARTTIVWSGSTIRDADIKINSKDFDFSYKDEEFDYSKVDLVSLTVHEIGHAIGFAHAESRESVMYPLLSKGYDRRDIKHISDLESYGCEYGDDIVRPAVLAAALKGEEQPELELEVEEEPETEVAVEEEPEEVLPPVVIEEEPEVITTPEVAVVTPAAESGNQNTSSSSL